MMDRNRCAKVNVKLLVILLAIAVGLGVSLAGAWRVQKGLLAQRALAAGEEAFSQEDWTGAIKGYRQHLGRHPDDAGILRKYAEACLSTRPLTAGAVAGAIAAYCRIVELDPADEAACEKLVLLYGSIGNSEELVTFARARLARDPNDLKAPLWLAGALAKLNRTTEAQQTLQAFIDRLGPLSGRHEEYVQACIQMSGLASPESSSASPAEGSDDSKPKPPTALDWLNRAAAYAPDSVEALVARARLQRRLAEMPGTSEQDKASLLAHACQDLEAADGQDTDDARLGFLLGAEWMAHGRLDRAAAALAALDRLPPEKIKESFFDPSDWVVARCLFALELATRKGNSAEAVAVADKTLASLEAKEQRARVLPSVIPFYVAAGQADQARRCLDEYLGLVQAQQATAESARKLAQLRALVAEAENRPYAVIDALEPVVGNDSSGGGLWRALAQAYARTGQAARAAQALARYCLLNPQDAARLQELAGQYAKLGDWQKVFDTAVRAESLGANGLSVRLLRIGAAIRLAAARRDNVRSEQLMELSAELYALRQANPDQVEIRVWQAATADALGQAEKAERELKLAIEECQEPLPAEMQLAAFYLCAKRTEEAVRICEAACQRQGDVAEPWLSLADVQAAREDYDAARQCLKQGLDVVKETMENRSLSIKLALLELTHGDRAAGVRLLRELASRDERDIDARALLLETREIQQDAVAAQALINELRGIEGDSGVRWRLYQASFWLSSDSWAAKQQEITDLLRYCIEADPTWSAPVLALAAMYEKAGDLQRFEDTCRQGLLQNPAAVRIADHLLALLERQGRYADAEKVLQQIDIDTRTANAWQIRMAVGAGDLSRAIDELKLRVSNDNEDANSRIQLARLIYQQTKEADQSLGYLKEAEALAPDSRTLAGVKASILKGEGQAAEALHVLDDYVADHNDFGAYWTRAVFLAEEGQKDRAEQDYRKLTTFEQNGAIGYELLANFYAGTERLDEGVAALEKGLTAHPQDWGLKRKLMQLLLLRGRAEDRDKALEILTALEERLPRDTELITVRARQALEETTPQDWGKLREKLEAAVKREPRAVNAHLTLIAIGMRQGDYKTACSDAVRALDANPGNPALLVARARAELVLGYPAMAVKLGREAFQQEPDTAEALGVIVEGSLRTGDQGLLQESRTLVDSFLARHPANTTLLVSRAHVLAALKLPQAAIPTLEAYCRSQEGQSSVEALVTLADLYRLAGDAGQAERWIDRAEQLAPRNQAVVHARFLWLLSQKRFGELAHISSAYLSAQEQNPTTVLRAASTLLSLDSMDLKREAVKLFEHASTLAPTTSDARFGLAASLYQTGDLDGAEKVYRQLLTQYPDNVRVLNDLAWILQEHGGRYADALELADRGLRFASDDPYLLDTRGTILSNLPDRLADAQKDYEQLLRQSTSDAHWQAKALLGLARISVKLDDLPQAQQYLEKATGIDRRTPVFTAQERSEIAGIMQGQSGPCE